MKTWDGEVCLVRRMFKHGEFLHYYVAVAVHRKDNRHASNMVLVLTIPHDFGSSNAPFFNGQEVSGITDGERKQITFYRDGYEILKFDFQLVDERNV